MNSGSMLQILQAFASQVEVSDWQAKRTLADTMFFFTLADTGGPDPLPLVTIPAQ